MPPYAQELKERLYTKRSISGGCWEFLGEITRNGYGRLWFTKNKVKMRFSAHRLSYMLSVGPIPEGLVIDHLCRNRKCFNPRHLEAVTVLENVRRSLPFKPKTLAKIEVCKRGHDNWQYNIGGFRRCHTCRKDRERVYQRNRRMRLANAATN